MTLKKWLCSSLLVAVSVAPVFVFAGTNDAADAKNTPSANADAAATPNPAPSPALAVGDANVTALLGVLVMKGVLSAPEANAVRNAAPSAQFQALVEALTRKGVVSAADLSAISNPAQPSTTPLAVAALPVIAATSAQRQEVAQNPPQKKPAAPNVVPAVAPLRVLAVDPPVKDGLVPSFKVGAVKVTPYGFIKATVVHDSSDPNGDDFPFPGIFLNSSTALSTGPNQDPSFHIKARSSRFGSSFEWPDISKHLTLTGRVEGDFEGGFTVVDNADVTSIRNPQPRLRLAFARLDYDSGEGTDVFFEGGQDWSLFGSTALPNILETTFLGAFSGDVWERTPQFRFGLVQNLGGSANFKLSPEFALMMPSSAEIYRLQGATGNAVGGLTAQIGEGEREGADSGRPEFEGRLALEFQLDKAPAVSSAQIFWSGYEGKRTSITTNGDLAGLTNILAQFPAGFTNSSHMFGNQLGVQLPTRWFTLVASAYRGGDMRFMLAGQLNTFFTDTTGLYNVTNVATVDNVQAATGGMYVGCTVPVATTSTCSASGGIWRIAPEHPISAFGGFVNLGLPLSRWFNANPKGHNAAWNLYLHAGKDQVVHHDLAHANGFGCTSADGLTPCNGGLPLLQSRMLAATLYYKLNPYVTFAFEQSQYQTTLLPDLTNIGVTYSIAGHAANKWKDQRTEFGPIFTF
ncbi:MAG TPA: hypothetical protein VJX47_08305 [Candidatus Sulfotelmatobacter sp.]|nr:hypothetical protein [Candidatus Sulfotelmatobacter sp.]